jgi:hypothetical protein
MQRVFVLDTNKRPLSPCSQVRARVLLRKGKAAVYRRFPFTIILKERSGGKTQPVEVKLDPGSKKTGVALVQYNQSGPVVVWAAEIEHRGQQIKKDLESRRAIRRGRRNRKTRYRQPRFLNRTRAERWLPPSLKSRVDNVANWTQRLLRFAPVQNVAVETVRFDMQKLENPEISGVQYQQGTLLGYEVREYLLEKFNRTCAYCGAKDLPLEIEHIKPKSKGGSNRISNLTLACRNCNETKGNLLVEEFLTAKPEKLKKLLTQVKLPLRDAAAVNATRYAIGNRLKDLGLPVSFWSGGRTKHNRSRLQYPKKHWIDAACVGKSGESVRLNPGMPFLQIKATGHGSRQMCRMDRFGFPRTGAKGAKSVKGFKTGDLVKAIVPSGKRQGQYTGRVAVRSRGYFNIKGSGQVVTDISWRFCQKIHSADGYTYQLPVFTSTQAA